MVMTNRGHVLYCGAILDFNFKTSVRKFCRKRLGFFLRFVYFLEIIFKLGKRHFRVIGFCERRQIFFDGIVSAEMFPDIGDSEVERNVKVLVQVLVVAFLSICSIFLNSVYFVSRYFPREISVM